LFSDWNRRRMVRTRTMDRSPVDVTFPILAEADELRWRRPHIEARQWSVCALGAIALTIPAVVGELLLVFAPIVSTTLIESGTYSLLLAWGVILLPIQLVCALTLGSIGTAHCRRNLRLQGVRLSVVSVILSYVSLAVWYSVAFSAFLSSERFHLGLALLAVVGVAWVLADRSAAGRWAAAGVLTVVIFSPLLPGLIDHRETARRKQIIYKLMGDGMNQRFGASTNSLHPETRVPE